MSQKPPSSKPGQRHPFTFQARLHELTFGPCLLLILLCAVLLVWDPAELASSRGSLSVILAGTAAILILTCLFRLRAFARCRADGLSLQFPFRRLLIPYHEILQTRPTDIAHMFALERMPFGQAHFLRPLAKQTVVVLEMDRLPLSRFQMRLWMSRYMICPDLTGLALPVHDWLALRSELDELRLRRPLA